MASSSGGIQIKNHFQETFSLAGIYARAISAAATGKQTLTENRHKHEKCVLGGEGRLKWQSEHNFCNFFSPHHVFNRLPTPCPCFCFERLLPLWTSESQKLQRSDQVLQRKQRAGVSASLVVFILILRHIGCRDPQSEWASSVAGGDPEKGLRTFWNKVSPQHNWYSIYIHTRKYT